MLEVAEKKKQMLANRPVRQQRSYLVIERAEAHSILLADHQIREAPGE
jgi:hypothetical protein